MITLGTINLLNQRTWYDFDSHKNHATNLENDTDNSKEQQSQRQTLVLSPVRSSWQCWSKEVWKILPSYEELRRGAIGKGHETDVMWSRGDVNEEVNRKARSESKIAREKLCFTMETVAGYSRWSRIARTGRSAQRSRKGKPCEDYYWEMQLQSARRLIMVVWR